MPLKGESPEKEIANYLLRGKAVITPTDTVYGILAIDENLILQIKKRVHSNKKTVRLINSISQIENSVPQDLSNLLNKYWPGALTVIFKGKGYRMPNSQTLLNAIKIINFPIYASSANITQNPTVQSLKEAKEIFKNSDISIEYIDISEGLKPSQKASTVFNYDTKEILREGEIKYSDISEYVNLTQE
ncbi:threonylcarbamoyl-AMP synthase [Candidatus Mycoplasma haematohominis]|uniref:L-threonylcarbamoyladenylate synthase n=1 Tax=Candidatus Mycoplasma haematohominis TaxID=1494318 RepID=A0A478FQK3_9MOLU|nr:threonylcarbamoyl-AMP synthase [Candidatus Mycoplasma haemohominis]